MPMAQLVFSSKKNLNLSFFHIFFIRSYLNNYKKLIHSWNSGEPNNFRGSASNLVEDCAALGPTGTMFDTPCSGSASYICEMNL